jgi:hypothetical protein
VNRRQPAVNRDRTGDRPSVLRRARRLCKQRLLWVVSRPSAALLRDNCFGSEAGLSAVVRHFGRTKCTVGQMRSHMWSGLERPNVLTAV